MYAVGVRSLMRISSSGPECNASVEDRWIIRFRPLHKSISSGRNSPAGYVGSVFNIYGLFFSINRMIRSEDIFFKISLDYYFYNHAFDSLDNKHLNIYKNVYKKINYYHEGITHCFKLLLLIVSSKKRTPVKGA